jgi:hypothetical protein
LNLLAGTSELHSFTEMANEKNESKGTQMAARTRQKANRMTDQERQAALGAALNVIYQKGERAKADSNRR